MPVRARLVLVVIWIASLVVVAAIARAQTGITPLPTPVVLSGSDVGFRVEGKAGTVPVGVIVIKVNGEWIVPQIAPSTVPRRSN